LAPALRVRAPGDRRLRGAETRRAARGRRCDRRARGADPGRGADSGSEPVRRLRADGRGVARRGRRRGL